VVRGDGRGGWAGFIEEAEGPLADSLAGFPSGRLSCC